MKIIFDSYKEMTDTMAEIAKSFGYGMAFGPLQQQTIAPQPPAKKEEAKQPEPKDKNSHAHK